MCIYEISRTYVAETEKKRHEVAEAGKQYTEIDGEMVLCYQISGKHNKKVPCLLKHRDKLPIRQYDTNIGYSLKDVCCCFVNWKLFNLNQSCNYFHLRSSTKNVCGNDFICR